jgi:hypothetical protein
MKADRNQCVSYCVAAAANEPRNVQAGMGNIINASTAVRVGIYCMLNITIIQSGVQSITLIHGDFISGNCVEKQFTFPASSLHKQSV